MRGLTLIEILLAVSIISFLGLVLYTTFYQGTNVWRRAVREDPELDYELFFEKLSSDLRNSFEFQKPPLIGKRGALQFYALKEERVLSEEDEVRLRSLPAKMTYFFDAKEQIAAKRVDSYYEMLTSKGEDPIELRPMTKKIKQLSFQYYSPHMPKKQARWQSNWMNTCWPSAVKAQIDYGEEPTRTISRVISLTGRSCATP